MFQFVVQVSTFRISSLICYKISYLNNFQSPIVCNGSWNWTLLSNQAWRLLNLKNDAELKESKLRSTPEKPMKFFKWSKVLWKMNNQETLVLTNKKQRFFLRWLSVTCGKKKWDQNMESVFPEKELGSSHRIMIKKVWNHLI